MNQFDNISDLDRFIKNERRAERIYAAIFFGTMFGCLILGFLIGQKVGM